MSPDELVATSAQASITTVGTEAFEELTVLALRYAGQEIAAHVEPDDQPGIFSPVDVLAEDKDHQGAVLVLADRVVLTWRIGTFRAKTYSEVIPRSGITDVRLATRSDHRNRESLEIDADRKWILLFAHPRVLKGGASIAGFLKDVLDGTITPVFSEGEG